MSRFCSEGRRAIALNPEISEKQWDTYLAAAMLADDFVLEEWPGEERAGEWESLAQDYARRGEEASEFPRRQLR